MLGALISALSITPALAMIVLLLQLFTAQNGHKAVSYAGQTYYLVPSLSSMPKATQLNTAFKHALRQADAIFVLGGKGIEPGSDTRTFALNPSSRPERIEALRSLQLSKIQTSWDFYQIIALQELRGALEDREGFSALCVKSTGEVTGVLHFTGQRDGTHVFYDTLFYSGPNLARTHRYSLCLRVAEDGWEAAPGASHLWSTAGSTEDKLRELSVVLSLPDPYLTVGSFNHGFSRFTYCEDVLR